MTAGSGGPRTAARPRPAGVALATAGRPVAAPPVTLDRSGAAPLAVQLADALRAAAVAGALRAGDRLPSTRALAVQLGLSRTVTAAAYDQLLAEGWVTGRRGSGTYVTASPSWRGCREGPPSAAARTVSGGDPTPGSERTPSWPQRTAGPRDNRAMTATR